MKLIEKKKKYKQNLLRTDTNIPAKYRSDIYFKSISNAIERQTT